MAVPVRFLSALLDRDDGRLALFYHSVWFLDPARQAFALGASEQDPVIRASRFKRLYEASTRALAGWEPGQLALRPKPL